MTNTYPHPIRTVWKLLAILRRDNPDITNIECGKQLGVNANSIGAWLRHPLYQSYETWLLTTTYDALPLAVKVRRADVKEELDEFAVEMLGRLRDIVEHSNDDKLIAQIGFDVLDRAGYAEPKRDIARSINLIMTPELVTMLTRRAGELQDADNVVVGEVVTLEKTG